MSLLYLVQRAKLKAHFPTTILGSPLCSAEAVKNWEHGSITISPCPNMFRMSEKVVWYNFVSIDKAIFFIRWIEKPLQTFRELSEDFLKQWQHQLYNYQENIWILNYSNGS